MNIYVNGTSEGRRVTLGPMDTQAALLQAQELQRKGYFRITLMEGLNGQPVEVMRFAMNKPQHSP